MVASARRHLKGGTTIASACSTLSAVAVSSPSAFHQQRLISAKACRQPCCHVCYCAGYGHLIFALHNQCAASYSPAVLPCRIHAFFFTNKICCEPLTEWRHFADLREAQPEYMLYLVRVVQALGVLVNSVAMELAAVDQPVKSGGVSARQSQLTDGIPWMLRNSR